MNTFEEIQEAVNNLDGRVKAKLSDGYHTYDELYEFRKMYNAALFNAWAKDIQYEIVSNETSVANIPVGPLYDVYKSFKHHDGEDCFGGGWFIVVAILPTGQISNHYRSEDWDLFKIPETDTAKYPFDGHTPADVLQRLKNL